MKAVYINKNLFIHIFDVEREIGYENQIDLRFLNDKNDVNCLGQLNQENTLYLCGSPKKDIFEGSYFLKFEILTQKVCMLVSSTHNHFQPSMISYYHNNIIVIGGKGSRKCEDYVISNTKWRKLPDLPERY